MSPRTALSHFIPDIDSQLPLPGKIWAKRGQMTCPESLTLSSIKSDPELDPLIQYNTSRAWCMGHPFLGTGIPLAIPFGPACLQSGHLFLGTVVWADQGRTGWILRSRANPHAVSFLQGHQTRTGPFLCAGSPADLCSYVSGIKTPAAANFTHFCIWTLRLPSQHPEGCVCVCVCVCVCECMHTWVYTYIYVSVCVYTCLSLSSSQHCPLGFAQNASLLWHLVKWPFCRPW